SAARTQSGSALDLPGGGGIQPGYANKALLAFAARHGREGLLAGPHTDNSAHGRAEKASDALEQPGRSEHQRRLERRHEQAIAPRLGHEAVVTQQLVELAARIGAARAEGRIVALGPDTAPPWHDQDQLPIGCGDPPELAH